MILRILYHILIKVFNILVFQIIQLHYFIFKYLNIQLELEAGHSIGYKLTAATRSPSICFALCDPVISSFWPNIKWVGTGKDLWWIPVASLVIVVSFWFCRADKQTHRQTRMNALLPRQSAWVNDIEILKCKCVSCTDTWPHLNSDVGLEEGVILTEMYLRYSIV